MPSQRPKQPSPGEVTPESAYLRRREFMRNAGLFTVTAASVGAALLELTGGVRVTPKAVPKQAGPEPSPLVVAKRSERAGGEPLNSYEDITTYNNFYEFGLDKSDPAEHAQALKTRPWTVRIEGEVKRPMQLDV